MRIHRLQVEGFGPFRESQSVDFDAFEADGIFLIGGRTGTGKSSVLDAVCFALYGGVPRYEGGEKRLRSDHCAPEDRTLVTLEFTAGDERWRIERSPEYQRPKRNGTGLTTQVAEARLARWDGADWEGVAARPRDVAERLHEVLPLTQAQFLQVILLAQNRFAQFLLAGNAERQALLRTLFDTRRFEDYEKQIDERRKQSAARIEAEAGAIERVLDEAERLIAEHGLSDADAGTQADVDGSGVDAGEPAPEAEASLTETIATRLAHLERAVDRAGYRVETAQLAAEEATRVRDAADAAYETAAGQRARQQKRADSRRRLEGLEQREPMIAGARVELAAAVRADSVRAATEARERAADAFETARERASATEVAWREATGAGEAETAIDDAGPDGADPGIDELRRRAAEAAESVGSVRRAAELESGLAGRRAELDENSARADELRRRRADAEQRCTGRRARVAEIDAELPDLAAGAADHGPAATAGDEAAGRMSALAEVERAASERAAAEAAQLAAQRGLDEANRAHRTLLERRLAAHAGELAADLVEGEPCAVCGSTEHPDPAPVDADAVSEGEIDQAQAALDRAMAEVRTASDSASAARDRHAAAIARTGGATRDELQAALDAARSRVEAAETATAQLEARRAERERVHADLADAEAERTALAGDLAQLEEQLAIARAALDADTAAVAEARADFATVAERIAHLERTERTACEFADALADLRAREGNHRDAVAAEQRALAAAEFADAEAAASAWRDADARAELDASIRAHESALAAEKATLLELELEALPDEPVDVEGAEQRRADARAACDAAVKATLTAEQCRGTLTRLARSAQSAHETHGALLADHEVLAGLADALAGRAHNTLRMKLETFVLAAELEQIVTAANLRLSEMSDGRYRLRHTDALAARGAASGLGIEVVDAFTGRARPTQSLSGGETFLASLALALGLAEVVTARAGGIRLDTLFIDEGFGSLDAQTLETAMRTLDELRQGGRTVGVISHVESMRDQIPAQVRIEATASGASVIRQEVVAPV
ncbi:SMC family ATPase [Microbacterium sp. LRZ72]|uniref:SMC family ATPase n=1 Tax=Microbacterium sp. LRZ72 TaxID=2942481 RepID=UPI0029A0E737|nr:SMC family ATPase [Microbacterium sp. LRZ72]MDX2376058.1 SMC family ATPase [Microbacterium sp. LRZ72]